MKEIDKLKRLEAELGIIVESQGLAGSSGFHVKGPGQLDFTFRNRRYIELDVRIRGVRIPLHQYDLRFGCAATTNEAILRKVMELTSNRQVWLKKASDEQEKRVDEAERTLARTREQMNKIRAAIQAEQKANS